MAMQSLGDSLVNQSPAVQDQITGNEKSQTRTKEVNESLGSLHLDLDQEYVDHHLIFNFDI